MRGRLILLSLLLVAAGGRAQSPAPLPSDLLQRVREAYLTLGEYRDEGDITVLPTSDPASARRYLFTTGLSAEDGFRFELRSRGPEADAAVIWSSGPGTTSPEADSTRSLPAPIAARLGAGAGDALVVAGLLARGSGALSDPEALALDGEEPCGPATCWRLQAAREGGALRLLLVVESGSARIRRVELEDDRVAGRPYRLEIAHQVERAVPRSQAAATREARADEPPIFSDRVEVTLTSIAVRVLDRGSGDPLRGLGSGDFRLLVGRREVPIEAVEWVSSSAPLVDEAELAELDAAGIELPSPGKLVVFFVQADFKPSRMIGQMRTLPEAKRFLDTLGLEDRVAVVSFDSHLKLRQDFTTERERVREAFDQAMLAGDEPWLRPGREPSLARHFDIAAAREAAVAESGLAVTARALVPLPGEKLIVFVGWGLGRFGANGVQMIPEYDDALAALAAAKANVFALDVTDADYHSLEVGLKQVARDTGGRYLKTTYHPKAALNRLAELVAGFYRITFQAPAEAAGERIRIELRDRRLGEVVAPRLTLGELPVAGAGG